MPLPPTLEQSLKHVALVGRFNWRPSNDRNRKLSIGPLTKPDETARAIGFELAYGPTTRVIDGRPYNAFAVAPPRMVEVIWDTDERRKDIRAIPCAPGEPLLLALQGHRDARAAGGQLFRALLDDLDALRPYW